MTTYLRSNLARAAAIAAAVIVAGGSLLALSGNKDTLLQTLGIRTTQGASLANNSCVAPRAQSDEVYFVSCAGFF